MKKTFFVLFALLLLYTALNVSVFAQSNSVKYYDKDGNEIYVNGMYYNRRGYPMFNANCYYLDEYGNEIYVGGCRAYFYDESGRLAPGKYYYDENGDAVERPYAYPGGYGCGAFYYDDNGNAVNGTFYYDDNGDIIELPQQRARFYRNGGCCGGYR